MKRFIPVVSFILFGVATHAHAATVYTCSGIDQDDNGVQVSLTIVSPTEVKVDDSSAVLDSAYSPRLNRGLLRFEYRQSDEGTTEALVSAQLMNDGASGMIKIQNRGEGFFTSRYLCKR